MRHSKSKKTDKHDAVMQTQKNCIGFALTRRKQWVSVIIVVDHFYSFSFSLQMQKKNIFELKLHKPAIKCVIALQTRNVGVVRKKVHNSKGFVNNGFTCDR